MENQCESSLVPAFCRFIGSKSPNSQQAMAQGLGLLVQHGFTLFLILSHTFTSFASMKPFREASAISITCMLDNKITDLSDSVDGWILINSRLLYKSQINENKPLIIRNIPLTENRYSIAIYLRNTFFNLKLIDVNDIDIIPKLLFDTINQVNYPIANMTIIDYRKPFNTLTIPILSTYYTTINVYTSLAWQNITYNMKQLNINTQTPNFETVIRTDDNITIYDLNQKWNWTISTKNNSIKPVQQMTTYYHQQPLFGYYCLYTNPNSSIYLVPDCPNATQIIKQHSKMLYSSGIDFMVPDDTNLVGGPDNAKAYILQIRPNELIYETYNELKNSATNVPKLAFWNRADGTQWETNLELYNKYSDLVYSAPNQNEAGNPIKKVYFVNTNKGIVNQTIIEAIEYDNGKNDIQIVYMWCNFNETELNNGSWTFFQPCTTLNVSSNKMIQTNSMETATDCNFQITKNSNLGSQISASFSWNKASHGSLPFGSPNKLNGRTFQLIIKDCLSFKPDNIFFPSFNEHTSGQHIIPHSYGGNNTWSNGLYKDKENRSIMFGDTYGSEVNRAIEPTKESGDYYYLLFQSCIRVIKLHYYFGNLLNNNQTSICNVENEICCNNLTEYNDIWSLKLKNESDYLLSNNINEVNNLIKTLNYKEICAVLPYANTSVFCESDENLYNFEAHQGPFILYKYGINPIIGSLAVTNISRIPIYRCVSNHNTHFIANNDNCNGIQNSTLEYLLGYAAEKPSSAMGRGLVRCINDKGTYYHTIGSDCFGDHNFPSLLLGYAL